MQVKCLIGVSSWPNGHNYMFSSITRYCKYEVLDSLENILIGQGKNKLIIKYLVELNGCEKLTLVLIWLGLCNVTMYPPTRTLSIVGIL